MIPAHAPLTPDRLHRVMATLAPIAALASAGGLRASPVAGRDGQSGGGDPQARLPPETYDRALGVAQRMGDAA